MRLFSRLAGALLLAGLPLMQTTQAAATPSSGTIDATASPAVTTQDFTGGPYAVPNQSPLSAVVIGVDNGPRCNQAFPCDTYVLTVKLPQGYLAAHHNPNITAAMSWVDAGTQQSIYALYVFKGASPTLDGTETADYKANNSQNPQVATIFPLAEGTQQYTIVVVPSQPTGESVKVHVSLNDGIPLRGSAGPCDAVTFGGPDKTCPGAPRYQTFVAPPGTSADPSNGEFNIGFDPNTGRILVMNSGPIWRITPAEVASKNSPEVAPELWEDKSAVSTNTGLDPILWTDRVSGRTFASNSTVGANAVYAYTDSDGDSWTPFGVGPPNGGADHETIGSGPLPKSLSALSTPLNQGEYMLYCSQDIVGPASCQRSLDLGMTWGPGVPAYLGNSTPATPGPVCGGLHGHVHIDVNGQAWLPVNQCRTQQGGAISSDGGITWSSFVVSGTDDQTHQPFAAKSQLNGADPSVGLDADGTAYYCYVNNESNGTEGHVHVAVSTDGGKTWVRDVDVGVSHGVVNAAETEAVGGSSGRAACGFLGTNVPGDYQAVSFGGDWYPFIATTYDQGKTWVTVNASPNDPVQRHSGIWQQGGGEQDRNLLDFNEITLDNQGRVLYGYSDGCVSPGCVAGTAPNDFVAYMRVARQLGGRTLLASQDPYQDTTAALLPKRAWLSGTRNGSGAHLQWTAPDNGGSDIQHYQVYRGTASGSYTLLGTTPDARPVFNDSSADPAVVTYYYVVKAVNGAGTGDASNELSLAVVIPPPPANACATPGLGELTDPAGDNSANIVLGQPQGVAPPGTDLLALQVAQPYAPDGTIKLYFTLTTDAGQSPQPPGSSWYVAMKIADPAPATTVHYKAVHMTWSATSPTTPIFESYTPSGNNAGTVDGRFVTAGSQQPADAASGYAPPYNQVVIVVKAGDLGLSPGSRILGFVAGVSQTDPAGSGTATGTYDEMPDGFAYAGGFSVNSNQVCRPEIPPVVDSFTATPTDGVAPLTVSFNGTAHSPDTAAPATTVATYHVDFGDGTAQDLNAAPTNLQHTYMASGSDATYAAKLTVTDSRGNTSANAIVQEIDVSAGNGSSSGGGSSGSSSSSGGTSSGGTSSGGSSSSSGGSSGGSSSGSQAPTASLQAAPVTGTAPLLVNFDASASKDPNSGGSITQYVFVYGDGNSDTTTSPHMSHTYESPGSYTATVTVTDSEGGSASASTVISAQSAKSDYPSASLAVSATSGAAPLAVSFDAGGSHDANGKITRYVFDFGDGSQPVSQTTAMTSHTYAAGGNYTASVTVTNSFGNSSAAYVTIQVSVSVTVTPPSGPVAELVVSPTSGTAPLTVTFDGSRSFDTSSGATIKSYTFSFGDGSAPVTQSGPSINHIYTQPGTYQPSLTVTDSAGQVSAAVVAKTQVDGASGSGASGSSGGGALGGGALLPLMLGALWRRRRRS